MKANKRERVRMDDDHQHMDLVQPVDHRLFRQKHSGRYIAKLQVQLRQRGPEDPHDGTLDRPRGLIRMCSLDAV
jgi:hypothetical protein